MTYDFILAIPDLHLPFEHQDFLHFCHSVYQKYKTKRTKVIQLGDFFDLHAFSTKFQNDPGGYSPQNELLQAQLSAHQWFDAFPEVDLTLGNHDDRISQKAFNAGLPTSCLKSLEDIMDAPLGWKLRDHFIYNNIYFSHGQGGGNVFVKQMRMPQNSCFGHFHTFGGLQYKHINHKLYWTMACGCGIDSNKYAFKYAKSNMMNPILGCGIIIDNNPQFIPMRVNKSDRWTGELP